MRRVSYQSNETTFTGFCLLFGKRSDCPVKDPSTDSLVTPEFTAVQRSDALARLAILRPHLEEGVPLKQAALNSRIPLRTVQRWLSRYRTAGLAGLVRPTRADSGKHKLNAEMLSLIEGLALRKPQPTVASVYRKILSIAKRQEWDLPSYASVYAVVRGMSPALVTLAQEGAAVFRDRFELVYRHRAKRPNSTWQADHTQLDILIVEANGSIVRPWLTTVIDDYSRVIAGFYLFLGAPSALHTSLALRQAIWRKQDPRWPVSGIPDVLYVDHGTDFTSDHLDQVAVDLHFELIHSTVARPQGRGKVERFFGTLNTELLSELPGYLKTSKPATPPKLSLPDLDAALGEFIIGTYNARGHKEIGGIPTTVWLSDGWLPRMPDSLEALDQLLLMVAKPRMIRRDGIHFQGLRYLEPTLAAYVGERVTIRYDPRDLGEIRVFHRNRFLCRAISPENAGQEVTLKEIQVARVKHRQALRGQIKERIQRVAEFLPDQAEKSYHPKQPARAAKHNLRIYREDV